MIKKQNASLYIGDNLTHLQELLIKKGEFADLIYVDAPYNTGSKLIYKDNRKSKSNNLLGTHESWYNFMLPRLSLAKDVLKSDGVIALSIDDYEFAYLKVLLDNIFGESNFLGCITVCRSKNGRGSKKNVSINHEYLLLYGKSQSSGIRGIIDNTLYNKKDEWGSYRIDGLFRKKGDASLRTDRPNLYFPLYVNTSNGSVYTSPLEECKQVYPKDSKGIERRWLWSKDTTDKRLNELYASKNGVVYIKTYANQKEGKVKRIKIKTIWDRPDFYTAKATDEIKSAFGEKVFDTPKPLAFMKQIIDMICPEKGVVLDIFSGSGVTAQAVLELNVDQGSSRECLLMESDSLISSNHIAYKYGYRKISEITEYRLRMLQSKIRAMSYTVYDNK